MPVSGEYGFGKYTPLKAQHFKQFINFHMKLVQVVMNRQSKWICPTYNYIDTTAGPGVNEEDGTDQAPLLFIREALEVGISRRAIFMERDPDKFGPLSDRLRGHLGVECMNGDHRQLLPDSINKLMPERKPKYLGLIYYDPTPCAEMFQSMKYLAELSKDDRLKRVDVLFYLAPATIKRLVKFAEGNGGDTSYPRLTEMMGWFDKKYWLVREPAGQHQWTFLLGTNWADFPEYGRISFYGTGTSKGKAILSGLNLTSKEREATSGQPSFFERGPAYTSYAEYLRHPKFLDVRSQVMRRANWTCEKCRKAKATAVHHLRYPPWGTFDVPENMIAICHPCHCVIHGKDN